MEGQTQQLTLRLPVELIDRADRLAGGKRKRSDVLREAIEAGLLHQQRERELEQLRQEVEQARAAAESARSEAASARQAADGTAGLIRSLGGWLARWKPRRSTVLGRQQRPALPGDLQAPKKAASKKKATAKQLEQG